MRIPFLSPVRPLNVPFVGGMIALVALNVGVDRISKWIALANLEGRGAVSVVGDYFVLVLARNQGAFLSAGASLPPTLRWLFLSGLPTLALLFAVIWLLLHPEIRRSVAISTACIIGGGVSNIFDRLFNDGRVVDFMNFGIGSLRTGILNVADLSITFGAIALFWFSRKDSENAPPQ
ncbi:MAG TPA: signal peptidase II [Fibrobacteraceae bacterium]|nr:signal peptidase II [Fibrobacteraceae bacterium]